MAPQGALTLLLLSHLHMLLGYHDALKFVSLSVDIPGKADARDARISIFPWTRFGETISGIAFTYARS